MATEFDIAKVALDEIAVLLRTNKAKLAAAKTSIAEAVAALTAMAATYATIISDIAQAAAANPNNPALQNMNAEVVLLVALFNAAKARAIAMKNAIEGL